MRKAILLILLLISLVSRGDEPSEAYLARVDSGRAALSRGDAATAEALFLRSLREEPANPGNALILSNLSEAQRLQGKLAEAVESCDIGLARYPGSSVLRLNRAKALLDAGRENEAVADLSTVLTTDSLNISALSLLTALLFQQGELDRSAVMASRLISADSLSDIGHYYLGSVEMRRGYVSVTADERRSHFATAASELRMAVELGGELEYVEGLVLALEELDDHEGVMTALDAGMKAYPTAASLYFLRALEHRRRFELDAAESDARSAISLGADPGEVRTFFPRLR